MWVNTEHYLALVKAVAASDSEKSSLGRHNAALETTLDWFRVRISQLEHERAVMLSKYMGIDMPVPTIERVREPRLTNPYDQMPDFNDVGNEMAKKLGMSWDAATGQVLYNGKTETD